MSVTKTAYNNLSKSSLDEQNKTTYDNANLDIIDSKLYVLDNKIGTTTTAYVRTAVEFIGALDTSKSTITFGGLPNANPFSGDTINKVILQEDIDISTLSSTHFGGGADEYYIIPSSDVVEIVSEGSRTITCTGFGIRVNYENTKFENITFENLGRSLLAFDIVAKSIVMYDVTFKRLKGTVKTGLYIDVFSSGVTGENFDNSYSMVNIFIDGFDTGFTVLKGFTNVSNITYKIYSTDTSNTNSLMAGIWNFNNVLIVYDVGETFARLSNIQLTPDFLSDVEGVFFGENLTTINCAIKSTGQGMWYCSDFFINLCGDVESNILNSSNFTITDYRNVTDVSPIVVLSYCSNFSILGGSIGSGLNSTFEASYCSNGQFSSSTEVGTTTKGNFNCTWTEKQVTTTATTAIIGKEDIFNLGDTTSNAISYTLPDVDNARIDKEYIIKDIGGNADTNNITITPSDSSTIDGQASYVINTAYGKIRFLSDGTNWHIV
jgi:hypothetical protein